MVLNQSGRNRHWRGGQRGGAPALSEPIGYLSVRQFCTYNNIFQLGFGGTWGHSGPEN